jgi:hypothetical protein
MQLLPILAVAAASLLHVAAAPAPSSDLATRQSAGNACASLAEQAGQGTLYYKPSEVLACFETIELVPSIATNITTWLTYLTEFQSTQAYLKNPPSGYAWPKVDLQAGLQTILSNIKNGVYKSEFAFENALKSLFGSAHDGHMYLTAPLHSAFHLARPDLVSFSSTGTDLPKVYLFSDLNAGHTPSAVTEINGQSIDDVLLLSTDGFQDKDATYNAALFNPATYQTGTNRAFAANLFGIDTNDTATYTFANGSKINIENWAELNIGSLPLKTLAAYTIPADWYDYFILAQTNSAGQKARMKKRAVSPPANIANPPATLSPSQLGFPQPAFNSSNGMAAGYFLADQPDTAVLNIFSFNVNPGEEVISFQATVKDFLAQSASQGKTKLLVDIRGNPGGDSLLPDDTFKQMFPTTPLYQKVRMRAQPATNALGSVISKLPVFNATTEPITINAPLAELLLHHADQTYWNVQNTLQYSNAQPFDSWDALYGPQNFEGDSFSEYFQANFPNEWVDIGQSGIVVSGYGNNTDLPPPVFAPSDITLVSII